MWVESRQTRMLPKVGAVADGLKRVHDQAFGHFFFHNINKSGRKKVMLVMLILALAIHVSKHNLMPR